MSFSGRVLLFVGLAAVVTTTLFVVSVNAETDEASTYCLNKGGVLNLRQEDGGQVGYCQFDNGAECEVWSYFRGECSAEDAVAGSELSQKTKLSAEITNLRDTYRGQLREYRDSEKTYTIAIDQYKKLGTLESIEKAVTATRELMISRAQVLQTHMRLLRLSLIDADGVEESFKKDLLTWLEADIDELDKSQKELAVVTDRVKLNELGTAFKETNKKYTKHSNSATIVLTAARLQNFYDREVLLRADVEKYLESTPDGVDAATKRSFVETDRVLKNAQQDLSKNWQRLAEDKKKDLLDSNYNTMSRDLNPIYVSLAQGMSYLEEIMDKND